MSNLENKVVSLELSKKLKAVGVPQKSVFVHVPDFDKSDNCIGSRIELNDGGWDSVCISAFLSSELGEMLWNAFEATSWKLIYVAYGEVTGHRGTSWIGELGVVNLMRHPDFSAELLLWLINNGHLDPKTLIESK